MKKENKKILFIGVFLLFLFAIWTLLVCIVDVKAIGPKNTSVGFATLNEYVHTLTGINMMLYVITDWLGFVPLGFALGFAILGFTQLIKRKSLLKVDASILILGIFYILTIFTYLFFEMNVINYRPVIIDGYLEASYPSSTTILVACIMPTAILQLNFRIKNERFKQITNALISAFIIFMIIGRLISGVHWITDIIGALFFSSGLVLIYYAFAHVKNNL